MRWPILVPSVLSSNAIRAADHFHGCWFRWACRLSGPDYAEANGCRAVRLTHLKPDGRLYFSGMRQPAVWAFAEQASAEFEMQGALMVCRQNPGVGPPGGLRLAMTMRAVVGRSSRSQVPPGPQTPAGSGLRGGTFEGL